MFSILPLTYHNRTTPYFQGHAQRRCRKCEQGIPLPFIFDILNEMDYFISTVSDQDIRKEKQQARDIRKTQWWKRKCAEGKCYYCESAIPPGELTMDHIVPVIRGGKSVKNNLAPACKECNNQKKHSLPIEWEEHLERMKRE